MHRRLRARSAWSVSASALALALLSLVATPARAEPPSRPAGSSEPPRYVPGVLRVTSPPASAGTVFMRWEGTVAAPMAAQLEAVFEAYRSSRRRFVLVLDSGGGSVAEGEKVIALLRRIRRSHTLDTSVGPGQRCGSMCLPIYLQGETRFGARTSSWLFHEVTRRSSTEYGRDKRVPSSSQRLIDAYWIPAGVSRAFIERMVREQDNYDWWQTGGELIEARAGIITQPIENKRPRRLEVEMMMPPAGSPPPQQPTEPTKTGRPSAPSGTNPLAPPTGLPVSGAPAPVPAAPVGPPPAVRP